MTFTVEQIKRFVRKRDVRNMKHALSRRSGWKKRYVRLRPFIERCGKKE